MKEYGICHIKKNMTRALHWYEKAAEAGDEVAAWKVKQLEGNDEGFALD